MLIAALVPAAQGQAPPEVPKAPDHLRAYSVTPPGQDGTITAARFASGNYGPHFDDQLEMYASLIDDDSVTLKDLDKYFHSMQFGPGEEIERTYQPTEGVTVFRDGFGIPHIYGDSLESASYALGYVTAEDRLFQMDVFRHAARGTLAEFVGPGANNSRLKMDVETRREGYTAEEVQALFDNLDDKYGREGKAIQRGAAAYAEGVTAYMNEIRNDPDKRPVEYDATGNTAPMHPEPWEVLDTLFLVVLQLRVFGETAGTELENAALYKHLRKRLGKKQGTRLYEDLVFQNDPRSPTSIAPSEKNFRTQKTGPVDRRSIAVPDNAEEVAREVSRRARSREVLLETLGFKKQASNALLVSGRRSKTGNPLLLGGPQVGHALPSFFMDIDVHAPGIDFRGPAVPGASVLVPLGRGRDYAWTLTTGYSDAVDTRAELLCEPGGEKATLESNHYMFKGKCRAMKSREETFESRPVPTSPSMPETVTKTFYRTVHGPVFARAAVGGKPAAFVKQRFFWKKELDSLPSFYRWNAGVRSLKDFADAAKGFTMSFNSFYVDHKNIAYFHVGQYPLRAAGVHPSLPVWGTGKWEWQGRRAYSKQPKIVNPKRGWIANWNNKPARGWDNHDGIKWGSIQRAQLLEDRMKTFFKIGFKATLADVVDAIRDAATRDARGAYLGPRMLALARPATLKNKRLSEASSILRGWIKLGAHRKNKDRDDTMDRGSALAIFDKWYDLLVHAVFDDELGQKGYELIEAPVTNYNPRNGGGFWFDFSSYLKNLFHKKSRKRMFSRDLCDNRGTPKRETCAALAVSTLKQALKELTEEQGQDMSAWTKPAENINMTGNANSATAGSVAQIPWQNRGTQNHVVEVLSKAKR
jgi:acyl-homoserine lactone acylase PvdQ